MYVHQIFTEFLPVWSKYWGFSLEIHIFLTNVGRCDQWVVMPIPWTSLHTTDCYIERCTYP